MGRLHLDPGPLVATSMGRISSSATATATVEINPRTGMIGRTFFYQGLSTFPRTLTRDWVQLTIVQ